MIDRNATIAADGPAEERRNNVGSPDEIPVWFMRHLNDGKPLSPEIKAIIEDVVTPLYRRMVLEEEDPLLRATGHAAVVTQMLEVLGQPEVLAAAKRAMDAPRDFRAEFIETLNNYLKTCKERGRAMNLHLQLRRAKHAPWQVPGDAFGIMTRHGRGI